ncbi:MAG: hypothetical protein LBC87_10035 [Fibromonadaceae bacterium]|jgi:hypothetical protein|nr:hypothetical protein [Fibromonadaceae bacterium]
MINAVSNSNGYSLIVTAENSKNAATGELGEQKRPDENLGYNLSLSDENWKTLGKKGEQELSEEDLRMVEELKKIDKKVHIHEQAHLSAAGGYARGGAHYDYVRGPDGNKYANSGHVNLDTSREKTPEATIRKANIIQKAALAPADPSPADKQIAANAAKMAVDAQQELAEEQKAKLKSSETTKSVKTEKSAKTPETETPDAPQVAVSESSG